MQRALLRVGGAAPDARVHEVAAGAFDREAASQTSRSAVSGLSGPAPSSSGGSSSLRCTISVVGLRLTPPSPPPRPGEA